MSYPSIYFAIVNEFFAIGTTHWLPVGVDRDELFGQYQQVSKECCLPPRNNTLDLIQRRNFIHAKLLAQHWFCAQHPEIINENGLSVLNQLGLWCTEAKSQPIQHLLAIDFSMLLEAYKEFKRVEPQPDDHSFCAALRKHFENYKQHNVAVIIFNRCLASNADFKEYLSREAVSTPVIDFFIRECPIVFTGNMFYSADLIDYLRYQLTHSAITLSSYCLITTRQLEQELAHHTYKLSTTRELPTFSEIELAITVPIPDMPYIDSSASFRDKFAAITFKLEAAFTIIGNFLSSKLISNLKGNEFLSASLRFCRALISHLRAEDKAAFWQSSAVFISNNLKSNQQHTLLTADYLLSQAEFTNLPINILIHLFTKFIILDSSLLINHLAKNPNAFFDYATAFLNKFKSHLSPKDQKNHQSLRRYTLLLCYYLLVYSELRTITDLSWRKNNSTLCAGLTTQSQLLQQATTIFGLDFTAISALSQLNSTVTKLSQLAGTEVSLNLLVCDLDDTLLYTGTDDGKTSFRSNITSLENWARFFNYLRANNIIPLLMTARIKEAGEESSFQLVLGAKSPLQQIFIENGGIVMLGTSTLKATAIRFLIQELNKLNPTLWVNTVLLDDDSQELEAVKAHPDPVKTDPFYFSSVKVPNFTQPIISDYEDFLQQRFIKELFEAFKLSPPTSTLNLSIYRPASPHTNEFHQKDSSSLTP